LPLPLQSIVTATATATAIFFPPSYIDSFSDEEGMHIIMEYASGGTLQQSLKAATATATASGSGSGGGGLSGGCCCCFETVTLG
jgi:hypothetical protein